MAGRGSVQIQVSFTGNWRTMIHVANNPEAIAQGIRNAKRVHPTKRIRAVDSSGRLVDML